jgi:hypothetical protein
MAKTWEPFAKQIEFLQIPFDVFEGCYGGAVGGGKTELLIMAPIVYGFHRNPKFKGVLFRKTFKQLNETLIPRAMPFYGALGAKYNETKHQWKFPSGAVIWASYLETMKDARDHDTAEYNYAAFEELTHFERNIYLYITSRVRTSTADLPAIVRNAATPGNIGHSWVRKRFVEPNPEGGEVIHDRLSDTLRIFIRARGTDNPHLVKNDPGYFNRLRVLPPAEQKARIDGDWWVFSGQVFGELREKRYEGEPDNALHVIKPFEIPEWYPKIIALDWGYTAHTWAGWFAIGPRGRSYLYREYYVNKTNISKWGAQIALLSQYELPQIKCVTLDPSAWQKRGTEQDIWEQFHDASGRVFRIEKADNDRVSGKLLIHDFLKWDENPSISLPKDITEFDQTAAQFILRNQGDEAYRKYLASFGPTKEDLERPRIQIFDTCPEAIKALQLCVYNEEGHGNIEDVAEFTGDDPYDGFRYGIKKVDHFLHESKKEAEKINELSKIIQFKNASEMAGNLQEAQTNYYRSMDKYEKKSFAVATPVFRNRNIFRRRRPS